MRLIDSFTAPTGRRAILKAGMIVGMQMGLGQEAPANLRPKERDMLIKVGDETATPLAPDDIPLGGDPTMAWAMDPGDKTIRNGSRLNRILLVRVPPERLAAETKALAAGGVVAYTAICTHAGCDVSDWIPDEQFLFCPCHDSTFDPKDGGKVIDGPAPRALPALPLKVAGKKLVVAGPFTARIYFEQN